jgi:hypothetical protein
MWKKTQTLKSIKFVLCFKGMKVVSGSLDVLETVGKKTFDVCSKQFCIEWKSYFFFQSLGN